MLDVKSETKARERLKAIEFIKLDVSVSGFFDETKFPIFSGNWNDWQFSKYEVGINTEETGYQLGAFGIFPQPNEVSLYSQGPDEIPQNALFYIVPELTNELLSIKCETSSSQINAELIGPDIIQRNKFADALVKICKIDVLLPLYSSTGRPAIDPSVFIRSFVLMQHLGYLSLHKWCDDLASDFLLQYLVGSFSPPSVASHYDFIVRLTGVDSHMNELFPKAHFKKVKEKKPKKGEKLINYSNSDTYYLLDKYKDGADCDRDRMMFTLQALFNALAVIPSIDSGFIDKNNLILSADGSSLHIHSSPFGHKVLDGDDSDNIYRFSAPDADIGWDSDLESFYLGYTFYNILNWRKSENL